MMTGEDSTLGLSTIKCWRCVRGSTQARRSWRVFVCYNLRMNSTPNDVFDEWYSDTHGGTEDFEMESDVDEIVSDISFDDPESY